MSVMLTSRHRARRAITDINVVPYIDVMLVLLVIFMVTAPLIAPSVINLPTVGGVAQQQQMPPIIVNIHSDGGLSVRYQAAGRTREQSLPNDHHLGEFVQHQQAHTDQPVVIAADKRVQYDKVMQVMSDLKAQHIKRVGLAYLVKPQ